MAREIQNEDIAIENAELRFKNFSGKEGKFNAKGNRNFCVLLNPNDADGLLKDGWNVRTLKPRDPEDEEVPYMQVKVNYDGFSKPIVWLVTEVDGKPVKKNKIGEEEIDILDWAEIKKVDLVIRPYHYDVNGKKGIKGYLKSMYVTIAEDRFASKYLDVPDSAVGIATGDID